MAERRRRGAHAFQDAHAFLKAALQLREVLECVRFAPPLKRFGGLLAGVFNHIDDTNTNCVSEEIPRANPPLSKEERAVVNALTPADLAVIDGTVLANALPRWLKVARVVLWTEKALSERYPGLSYVYYARRLIELVDEGRLESQGNLKYMRFSEVRIPS